MAANFMNMPLKPAGDKPRTIYVTWKKADAAETKDAALIALVLQAK